MCGGEKWTGHLSLINAQWHIYTLSVLSGIYKHYQCSVAYIYLAQIAEFQSLHGVFMTSWVESLAHSRGGAY